MYINGIPTSRLQCIPIILSESAKWKKFNTFSFLSAAKNGDYLPESSINREYVSHVIMSLYSSGEISVST